MVSLRKPDSPCVTACVVADNVDGWLAMAKTCTGTDEDYSIHWDVVWTVVDEGAVRAVSYVCIVV